MDELLCNHSNSSLLAAYDERVETKVVLKGIIQSFGDVGGPSSFFQHASAIFSPQFFYRVPQQAAPPLKKSEQSEKSYFLIGSFQGKFGGDFSGNALK